MKKYDGKKKEKFAIFKVDTKKKVAVDPRTWWWIVNVAIFMA